MSNVFYSEITPDILKLSRKCEAVSFIDPDLYTRYDVKRGLRDLNGKGVLAGLTEISKVIAKREEHGEEIPCEGQLYYRGQNIHTLVKGFSEEQRFGFEETAYLLLFGSLPDAGQLSGFRQILSDYRKQLPSNFARDILMNAPSPDMMNVLARSVLTLYAYDRHADEITLPNVLRQCLQLISMLPVISVYGYQTYQHYYNGKSLYIHTPDPELSFAENILYLLRKDGKYTALEAHLLDIALVLHMEHGGGNNSTFTTHVVSSSGTDTYSAFAASLGSLKGPRHGGANIKVVHMMEDLKKNVRSWQDEDSVRRYLKGLLNKEQFDRSGLIYGIGHAVYSLSDPRAQILKIFAEQLSREKHLTDEYELYCMVERLAPEVISEKSRIYKGVSANVDFYSGFVYKMLNLPLELFTPMFAMARTVGWSAHRIEELANNGKIIRPAYLSICEDRDYIPIADR